MVNKLFNDIQKDRYKVFKGYKFDRWLFQIYMLVIFGFLFYVAYSHNFDLDYFECGDLTQPYINSNLKCLNPFYEPDDAYNWKHQEYVYQGAYGYDARKDINLIWAVIWVGAIGILVLNHFTHNDKYKINKLD